MPQTQVRNGFNTFDNDPFSPNLKYKHLRCAECKEDYPIPRDFEDEREYVDRKLKSRELKDIKILNLDDEAIPIAKDKITSKDNKYFVKAVLTESKVGQRLIVYVGERGKKEKTQIFVEPSLKRLAFDQKDTHPSEIFVKLEATFTDGSTSSMQSKKV